MKKSIFALLLAVILVLCGCTSLYTQNSSSAILPDSEFSVHFIDVGQADASLIISGDETMLIDGGNVSDSSRIVTYLKKHNIEHLDYIICSHAHEDHVGGLSGALSQVSAGNVYAPRTQEDSKAYLNFTKKVSEQGLDITNPDPGESFSLGDAEVIFLGPVTEDTDELNNTSIVLKVAYGNTSFLFTGDAERDEEADIINEGYDLSADVLKVGHHGSHSSTSYPFLREVMPDYAIISVGKDNSYNHPSDEVISRLEDAGANVYRTDLLGDIVVTSDGENISITGSKADNTKNNSSTEYIGNKKSKKYHISECKSLPIESNRVYFSSKDEAESENYTPCGQCM